MAFDLNTCNTKKLRNKANYGVRVARPGYDASSCAQNQLVFNSNWPIIQITDVIDLSKDVETKYVWLRDDINYTTGEYEREWRDTEPAGMTYTTTYEEECISVGKKYVWHQLYWQGGTASDNKWWKKIYYKQFYHGLGYPPMFYRSEDISEISGYIVLTSIALNVDIDYPYTEGATMFVGGLNDYGISSSSKFGKRVPGLRSDMFSKLVQAVKTEKTSNAPIYTPNDLVSPAAGWLYWSPLDNLSNYKGCLEPYEAVAYNGFDNPFGCSDVDTTETMLLEGFGSDGPYYVDDARARSVPYSGIDTGSGYDDGVAFTNAGQGTEYNKYASLVITRTPMVSPEYEELVV